MGGSGRHRRLPFGWMGKNEVDLAMIPRGFEVAAGRRMEGTSGLKARVRSGYIGSGLEEASFGPSDRNRKDENKIVRESK